MTRDLELECDVCVVGSGAGGGTAAARLAAAGLDVVLEAGDYDDDRDFDGAELRGYGRYLGHASAATRDQSVGILAGACLGGGTVVNYTTSSRLDEVREEGRGYGVPASHPRRSRRASTSCASGSGSTSTTIVAPAARNSFTGAWASSAGTRTRCRETCSAATRA